MLLKAHHSGPQLAKLSLKVAKEAQRSTICSGCCLGDPRAGAVGSAGSGRRLQWLLEQETCSELVQPPAAETYLALALLLEQWTAWTGKAPGW